MILVLLSIAVIGAQAAGPKVEKIYVERMRTSDLDSSATGYIYRNDGQGPGTYVKLGNDAAGQYFGGRSKCRSLRSKCVFSVFVF